MAISSVFLPISPLVDDNCRTDLVAEVSSAVEPERMSHAVTHSSNSLSFEQSVFSELQYGAIAVHCIFNINVNIRVVVYCNMVL